jgi:hypothetical protein
MPKPCALGKSEVVTLDVDGGEMFEEIALESSSSW